MQDETRTAPRAPRLSPITPLIYRFILDCNRPILGSDRRRPGPRQRAPGRRSVIWIAAPRIAAVIADATAAIRVHGKPIRCIRARGAEIQCAHGRPGRCTLEVL